MINKNRGFTLMETIVSLAVFAIIITVLLYMFDGYQTTFSSQLAITNAAGSARMAMNEIQSNVLEASQVLATSTIYGTLYTTGTSTLVLQLPARDSSGDIVSGKSDNTVFYVNGAKLFRLTQVDASSSRNKGLKLLTDALSSISFTYNNVDVTQAGKITVDLTTNASSAHTSKQVHLQEQIYLRNN